VRAWGEAGHAIGNHSYSHRNLASDDVALTDYIADVARDQTLLEALPGWVRRYRFPYLKEGDTIAKRDGFRAWLSKNDYASGAVSIDASDWYYSSRYAHWRRVHPDADPAPFREAYLAHLLDRARYYDGLSRQVLGRSIPHVILLHTNAINAAFLPDVLAMFREQGWQIVSPQQAYADPVYARELDVLPAGESILWSLAKQAGVDGLRYPAEDGTYEKAKLDALER
jgi:peptidoglycan/xylan/chitin deacetylase (PgdA/CDA1 family)